VVICGVVYFGKHYIKAPEFYMFGSKEALVIKDDGISDVEVEYDGKKVRVKMVVIPWSSINHIVVIDDEECEGGKATND